MLNIYKTQGNKINGINVFINNDELQKGNKEISRFYNFLSFFYDVFAKVVCKIKFGGEYNFRNESLKYITINDNDMVLETSVGTGSDLRFLNRNAKYYGVDISQGMLKKALKNIRKWKIETELVCSEAENLPFCDDIFDVVFSVGGFNYYSDKEKAIREMIRVSKPGKRIFIVDETEKTVKKVYKNGFGTALFDQAKAYMPIGVIAKEMKNIDGKIINDGYFYIVSFDKP